MDRNTITGLVLIVAMLAGWMFYNSKEEAKLQEARKKQLMEARRDSLDRIPATPVTTNSDTTIHDTTKAAAVLDAQQKATATSAGPFTTVDSASAKNFVLENEDLKVTLSSKGGEVSGIELKKFKTFDGKALILVKPGDAHKAFKFVVGSTNISTSDLLFESTGPVVKGDTTYISLKANAGNGYFEQSYALGKKGYLIDYKVNMVNLDSIIPRTVGYLSMDWNRRIPKVEKDQAYENRYTQLDYRFNNGDVERMAEGKDAEQNAASAIQWISYKQQFFNTSLISLDKEGMKSGVLHSKMEVDSQYLKNTSASVILSYDHKKTQTYSFQYYFGPNNYNALKKLDIDLEKIISMGWFGFINKYVFIPSFHLLEKFIGNYGIIILVLTLFIKILLTPLTYKSQLSMAKMKVLKPELDELKEKYKDDQQKFGTAQMQLFSKAGVSPLGGCLPTLLIMPFLVAMYNFFPNSIELRQQAFLWAHDLSTYDSILNLPFAIPFYGSHVSLFTILMTITSIIYALANSQLTGTQEGPMKYMPYIMPIMLLGMFNSFPAALTYFYLLNNLISYAQQYGIQKFFINEAALHKQIQENKKKPAKTGGFAENLRKRLEDAQKQQEQGKKQTKKK